MTHSDQTSTSKEQVKAAAGNVADDARSTAKDLADTASAKAAGMVHQAQDSAADEVRNVASALRTAADDLRSGSPQERTFSQIADGLADASDAMRDKDLGEMVGELGNFARRNPMVFLGSAALIGFAATRFAKASDSRNPQSSRMGQTGSSYTPARSPATPYTSPSTSSPSTSTSTPSPADSTSPSMGHGAPVTPRPVVTGDNT